MSTAIAKPVNFEDLVRDRVRTVIMDAVPAEQIDALIKNEFDRFFTHKEYNNQPTKFGAMVQLYIDAAMKEKIKAYVDTAVDKSWDENNMGPKVLEEVVTRLAPAALQAVAANLIGIALNNFRNNMR